MHAHRFSLPTVAVTSLVGVCLTLTIAQASAAIVADSFAGVIVSLLVQA